MIAASHAENTVALCDVDDTIDAVTIGIPDFMHATVALACMERCKHVYLEKPLTTTPWEARLLRDAAVKYKMANQMGNQGFSHESIRVAAEMVWSGAIGDGTEVHIPTTPGTHPTGLQSPAAHLDGARASGLGKLEWDSKNLRFPNNREANNYVKPAMRKGWELKL